MLRSSRAIARSLLFLALATQPLGAGEFDPVPPEAPPPAGLDCNQNGRPDGEDVAPSLPSFSPPVDIVRLEGVSFRVAEILDLDGDARRDLLLHEYGGSHGSILSNRLGVEQEGPFFELLNRWDLAPDVHTLAAQDLNQDGRPDLLAGRTLLHPSQLIIEVRFGREQGRFADPDVYRLGACGWSPLLHGDLDGDGDPDLAIPCWPPGISGVDGNELQILLNRGNGILDPRESGLEVPAGGLLADLDGDQDLDLAGVRSHRTGAAGEAVIGWNRGDGTFEETIAFPVWSATVHLAAVDIDGDGDVDIAVHGDPLLVFFRNDGRGSFAEHLTYSDVYRPQFGDLDGDGAPDLVTARGEARVCLWWNLGDGSFAPPSSVTLSGRVAETKVADLDGDGLGDVVTSPAYISNDAVSVICGRRRGPSLDCDGDGTPDECAPPAGGAECRAYALPHECAGDCDFDGRTDACEIAADGAPDCDRNGVPDTCEVPGGVLADCNQDGISDYCQPELNCNRDGIADACQELYDGDRNGVPDECEARNISFHVTFGAPATVRGRTQVEATILLDQRGLIPGEDSTRAWTLFAKAEGCKIIAATTDGTDALVYASASPFENVEVTCPCPGGYNGAIVSTVLSLRDRTAMLPPTGGPYSVLRMSLEGNLAADGTCVPCTLGLVEVDDCNRCHTGETIQNLVEYRLKYYPPSFTPRTLHFCTAEFHRGDPNADGRLDISDPIVIFDHLFLGGTRPACLEAADAQNDGRIELTDGIRLLEFLFREGPPPAPPGGPREPCGPDPEEPPGHFGCEEYPGC